MIRWRLDLFVIIICAGLYLNSSYADPIDDAYEDEGDDFPDEGDGDQKASQSETDIPSPNHSVVAEIAKRDREHFDQVILSK